MKRNIKENLLSINNNAFRFLHDVEGFDFEKPYFIAEQPGKFTATTVIKAVQEAATPTQCKIVVFVVPAKTSHKEGLFFAALEGGKFDGTRRKGASYWDYKTKDRTGDIDCCWGVGDFEELRKHQTDKIFIIAQDKAHTATSAKKALDFSARYALVNSQKYGDGHGNTYIGELDIEATDGSGTRYKYKPYNTFYGYKRKSADIADFIDKSGYLLRPRRLELLDRAVRLRKQRKQAEANNADFTKETEELQTLIDKSKAILSGSLATCIDSETAKNISNRVYDFSRALSYFSSYMDKLESQRYASIDSIKADIQTIKDTLNYCITGNK